MDQAFQPLVPAHAPAPPVTSPAADTSAGGSRSTGFRRVVLTGAISALLLVGGGVAAVSAASPAPSTAPGTTAPSGAPGGGTHSGSSANCPNMGGSGSGSSGSSGSSAPAATPAT
ncbi:MAG TPA: hypothetical protein VGM28_09785 [Candidatus Limnocylindrales bacterium]